MTDSSKFQKLLIKVSVISKKYEKFAEITGWKFNIFQVLGLSTDEVKTHSKFLAELLNPKGSHGQGNIFLKLFLEQLDIKDIDANSSITEVERHIGFINDEKTEGGNIDIIVEDKNKNAIIIENKIYAGDQENQLLRYFNYGKTLTKSMLIYLTLDGKEPSDWSLGELSKDDYQLLSYKTDILQWLQNCKKETTNFPILRETLTQYINLIKQLTGQTMEEEEIKEILDILSENENIIEAQKIVESWKYIRLNVELNFWEKLETIIKGKGFEILDTEHHQKYKEKQIRDVINHKRGCYPWYGIMIELFTIDNNQFCFYLERGYIELHMGITVIKLNEKKRVENITGIYKEFADKLKEICPNNSNEPWWLCKRKLNKNINFESFSNEDTLLLINDDKRKECLKEVWAEMEDFIKKVKNEFETENLK